MIILCLLQIAVAPSPASPVRFELPNGLRVWVQEERSRPVALVQVTYKIGSLHEGPGTTGIAHFVEHMVYRATENIRNEDIYGYIDRIGGRYTGGTWPDVTRYAETVPSWALESALRVTAERMSRALFDSLEFERERSNVVTEANGFSEQDAPNAFRDAVLYTSFEAHPYRYNSNTWARDNLVLTRAEAYEWYKRYYGPNNAVLVVVGDVHADSVRRLVEKHFASLPRAARDGEIRLSEPPQQVEKRVLATFRGDTRHIEIVYHAPRASDADYPAFSVTNRLLGAMLARQGAIRQLSVTDSATQYPFVSRISIAGDTTMDPERILALLDAEVSALQRGVVDTMALNLSREIETVAGPVAAAAPGFIPPRTSNLTRMADSLFERERLPWEVSGTLRARIEHEKRRVTPAQVRDVANRWLQPWQRTIGFLVPGPEHVPARPSVPPLTTPPARRLRPEAVPARALQPLPPIPIASARRVLHNGVVLRAARITGPASALHVRVDYGDTATTISRAFPADSIEVAMAQAAAHATHLRGERPPPATDSSTLNRARTRVLANILPVRPLNASGRAWITVSIVGPRAPEALMRLAERRFATFPAPPSMRASLPGLAAEERIREERAIQVHVVAGLPAVARGHPDRRALELLNYIVGVPSYGGRLGWALTKTGLTYASAAVTTFGESFGHVLMSTTSDTRNTDAVIQALREVVEGMAERGVEAWELREAQAFTLGRATLYHARPSSPAQAIAAALTESELAGVEHLDPPGFSRAYLAVTLDDVNRVARTYYRPERLKIVAIGAVDAPGPHLFPRGTFRALFELDR